MPPGSKHHATGGWDLPPPDVGAGGVRAASWTGILVPGWRARGAMGVKTTRSGSLGYRQDASAGADGLPNPTTGRVHALPEPASTGGQVLDIPPRQSGRQRATATSPRFRHQRLGAGCLVLGLRRSARRRARPRSGTSKKAKSIRAWRAGGVSQRRSKTAGPAGGRTVRRKAVTVG
jgi:hypothetical protein